MVHQFWKIHHIVGGWSLIALIEMHIVVLTGYWYPYTVPPAGCAKHYLLELAKENEVEIVCPPSNTHFTEPHTQENIKINYINSIPNKALSYIKTNQEEHRHPRMTKFLFDAYRGLRFLKNMVSITPYETSLVKPYVKELEGIKEKKKIDVVMSVSFDFYTHAAALKFKKLHPEIKWITYTTDPLAYSEVNPIEKRKLQAAKSVEQEVYTSCDFCITTEELYPNIVNDYHIAPEKVLGLPFLLLDKPLKIETYKKERPLVVYAGYLYFEIRNPQTMMEVFSRIKNVDLHLHVTGDRHIRQMLGKRYPENIVIDGLVSRDKYLDLLGEASILINLCNTVKLQAPSKITELVSTGKPIINFYYNQDSGYRMIEKYPLGINISNDMDYDEAARMIDVFIKENAGKSISFDEVKALYPEHSLMVQMPKIEGIIKSITKIAI